MNESWSEISFKSEILFRNNRAKYLSFRTDSHIFGENAKVSLSWSLPTDYGPFEYVSYATCRYLTEKNDFKR